MNINKSQTQLWKETHFHPIPGQKGTEKYAQALHKTNARYDFTETNDGTFISETPSRQ